MEGTKELPHEACVHLIHPSSQWLNLHIWMPLELGRVTLPHPAFCSPDKFLFLPPPLWDCALVILEVSFLFLPQGSCTAQAISVSIGKWLMEPHPLPQEVYDSREDAEKRTLTWGLQSHHWDFALCPITCLGGIVKETNVLPFGIPDYFINILIGSLTLS